MKTKKTGKQLTLAATAALLISGCASDSDTSVAVSTTDMGQCHGVNACKGSGSCATADNPCATQNTCKGKGWLPLSAADCHTREGRFIGFNKRN